MALTYVNQVGAVEGMNQAAPGTLIPDTFIRWSQDVLFDRAGLIRRRGPFSTSLSSIYNPSTASNNEKVLNVVSCLNPLDERIVAVIVYSETSTGTVQNTKVYYYKKNGGTYAKQAGSSSLEAFVGKTSVDAKAALGGGAWLGFIEKYGVSTATAGERQALYYWRGGYGDETYTKSGIIGVDNPDTPITDADHKGFTNIITRVGSETFDTTKITPGMFVNVPFSSGVFNIGVVKSVTSTEITLEKKALRWFTAGTYPVSGTSYTLSFSNVRPYVHRHGRGLLTKAVCVNDNAHAHDILSGAAGSSSEGHWGAAGIGSGNYQAYAAKDYRFIGIIRTDTTDNTGQSVNVENSTAQLVANNHSMPPVNADEYIMIKPSIIGSPIAANRLATDFTGIFTATYAGFQWYGCLGIAGESNRIVFSASHDPEAVDLSKDAADSIMIPGIQKMRGIASSNSGLVVLMEDKVYLIRGNSRANFSLELLFPEGCICNSSIIETGGGVVWASRAGLLYYDGATVRNLTSNNLGVYYSDGVTSFDPDADTCHGFMYRDYVFFHFTKWASNYGMTRYEPVYAVGNQWASSVVSDNNTIIDAGSVAGEGLANQSWQSFAGDNLTWEDISVNVNEPLGWDYEEEKPTNITFAIYLPTGAITTISNFPFSGATFDDGTLGLKALVGVTREATNGSNGNRIDLYNIDTMLDSGTDGEDHALSDNAVRKGPDMYIQTKHYTVGDPVLKKWFQKLMLNLLLERGAVRVDFIDAEDNDAFDVYNLKHRNWEVFTEKGLTWDLVETSVLPKVTSPVASSWINLEHPDYPNAVFKGVVAAVINLPSVGNTINDAYIVSADNALYVWFGTTPSWQKNEINYSWLTLLFADYERQTKRFSLRQPTLGFRLYQLNKYREPYQTVATKPQRIQADAWNIGYKPLRGGRV